MSFWDNTFGAMGTATPPPEPDHQPSLNEEVTEVIGQLGRFWGGFRKQSQDALQAAKKDLGEIVTQAQKELTKLSVPPTNTNGETSSGEIDSHAEGDGPASPSTSASTSASVSTLPGPSTQPSASQSSTLFSRLQASLPPDLITTLRDNLPETIRHAPEHLDLTQLRTTLQNVRVQDATARGEELLRGAGDFLRDAVRVVPPSEVVWDGADFSAVPSGSQTPRSEAGGRSRERSARSSGEGRTISTRREALLRAVRTNSDILKVDPAGEKSSEALFKTWFEKEVASKEGGIGGAAFSARKEAELEEEGLEATQAALVPSEMAEDDFWTRYFFRVFQIEQEEERRKALLRSSAEQEEDFSWEDEDEEAALPTATLPARGIHEAEASGDSQTAEGDKLLAPRSQVPTPGTMSPSQSEDSYDLVSSGHTSTTGEGRALKRDEEDEEDSAESDWE
ncbi:hypothetical protein BV25DRAFT_1830552 [Artomyces pyxidatus]|uniref:Uncharacterized protein n=1 Tax=Artomyces pyxidatus TaxID=48021 RepID=A0ACB8SN71_9AGAM|nr:hypothetical protein BV25DRAFT_1830552 [Artomyces pyxidatus]